MLITVNGEDKAFDGPLTVDAMLAALGIDGRRIAVERNREIVPKSAFGTVTLEDGDQIEIVQFIGGG